MATGLLLLPLFAVPVVGGSQPVIFWRPCAVWVFTGPWPGVRTAAHQPCFPQPPRRAHERPTPPPGRPGPAARPGSRGPQGACVGAALPPRCCPRAQTRAFLRGEPGPSPALGHLPSPRLSSSLSRCLSSVGRAFFIVRLLCLTTSGAAPLPFCEGSPWVALRAGSLRRWPPARRSRSSLCFAPRGRRTQTHTWSRALRGPQAAAAAHPGHRRVSPPQPPLADSACKRCGRAVPPVLCRPGRAPWAPCRRRGAACPRSGSPRAAAPGCRLLSHSL